MASRTATEEPRVTSTPLWGLGEAQVVLLEEDLPGEVVKSRKKGSVALSYVEGHYAIRVANKIFGFAGWRRETKEMRLVAERPYKEDGSGYLVCYVARIAVHVQTEGGWVESDGWGYGEGIDYHNPGQAHESAVKEAETDAMKRAMVKWGDPFGLALYDKQQTHVDNGAGNGKPAPRPAPVPGMPGDEERTPVTAPAQPGAFENVGQLFQALLDIGFGPADRDRIRASLGMETPWPEMGPAGWAKVYAAAQAEKGGQS